MDPAHFRVNLVPPPVALERFAVDDVTQPLHAADYSITVPAGHNHFQFDYAGLSFVAPQKVRYRFMLEGFDHDWTEAGSRRTAYYTNIPPGHYTFRVQAANNDGVWNTQGAALAFELRPHFYQTALVLCAAGGAALAAFIVLLLRLRLLRAEREFRAVLGERNRIAREIHDTLAQGYVGISVQLEVLSELLRHNKVEAAAKHLDKTRGLRARRPGRRAPVDLVAALAGRRRDHAAGADATAGGAGGRAWARSEIQPLWRLSAHAAGHRARIPARGAGGHS